MTLYNLATSAPTPGVYPGIGRAMVVDPVNGHIAGGRAYATHYLRNSLAFNLGYSDGSVQTAYVKGNVALPLAGEYKQGISFIQYLEEVIGGTAAAGDYVYDKYAGIPMIP
jgi:hypothetical protein